jgi:hypothetical protein
MLVGHGGDHRRRGRAVVGRRDVQHDEAVAVARGQSVLEPLQAVAAVVPSSITQMRAFGSDGPELQTSGIDTGGSTFGPEGGKVGVNGSAICPESGLFVK